MVSKTTPVNSVILFCIYVTRRYTSNIEINPDITRSLYNLEQRNEHIATFICKTFVVSFYDLEQSSPD